MRALGFGEGAGEKNVPDLLWNLPDNLLAVVLRAYSTGDGSVREPVSPVVELGTSSERLAGQLSYLLLRFGVLSRTYVAEDGFHRFVIGVIE